MHRRVDGRAPQLALDHLQAASTYFVRVDVRNTDGTVTRSNAVYRFTTLGGHNKLALKYGFNFKK
jgi:hypothetical protein